MKKRILSFFLAITIMFTVFVPVPALVSADDVDISNQPYIKNASAYKSGSSDFDYVLKVIMNYLKSNKTFYSDQYVLSLVHKDGLYHLFINHMFSTYQYSFNYNNELYDCIVSYDPSSREYKDFYCSFSSVDSSSLVSFLTDNDFTESRHVGTVTYMPLFSENCLGVTNIITPQNINNIPVVNDLFFTSDNCDSFFVVRGFKFDSSSSVIDFDYPTTGILIVDVDIDSFTQWIIDNKRYEDIANCGLDIAQDKIKYLVEWWTKYGTNPAKMLLGLPKLISNINILNIDISLISSVCNCIDNLYIEYKRYVTMMEDKKIQYDHSYWPGHLQEDDDGNKDYTYVTDTEEDDVYTSLLREILRAISSLPDLIATKFSYLQTYLDSILIDFNRLLNYITLLPDSFADSAYNVFIDPINQIIEALGNVGSSTNIEIEIPDTKKDEVYLFFDEWHTNFSDAINNKVPVYSQLSSLFNDSFFEKCGLDVNGDGETFAYYTAPGSVGSGDVQTLALNTSALSDSGEHVAVRSLLEQFDHADTSYLDDASYSGDIPEGWTVTVGGQDIEIFDFRIYAKHRTKIHVIITFILYSTYLLSLFKSIPTLIGNVSDVRNAFDAHSQKEE